VLKVLEDQGLLRATGKTIVVFNARPKMKTRPVIVPVKQGVAVKGAIGAVAATAGVDEEDDDDDWDDDDEE
jgi:CRP/FNR family transcriptional regulator, cyclic AMP receptor protein